MRILAALLVGLAAFWFDAPARAAEYPTRPVTLIVAFTPGGPSDVLARVLGKKLERLLGQPFVVENRPGAGGNIAAELAARAAPDGYTLLMGNNSILATNASLYRRVGFDAEKDFAPISLIGSQANILVVNPALPVRSMAELIALARKQPGQINFASSGHGAAGASGRRAVQGGGPDRYRACRLQGGGARAAGRDCRARADDVPFHRIRFRPTLMRGHTHDG